MVTKIVSYTAEQAKALVGTSDVERVAALTDEEIREAAKSDPDSALPTAEELKEFKRVKPKGGGT
jgi:hypothetical protein